MEKRLALIILFSFVVVGCTAQVSEVEPAVIEEVPQEEELIEPEVEVPVAEETVPEPEPIPEVKPEVVEPVKPEPKIINGKTLEERIEEAYDNLHEAGSSDKILSDFPDVELVYTDDPEASVKKIFPPEILPFHYYYSEEADKTFNLCGVGRSVFICDGKLDREITIEDIDSGRCEITPIYLSDPRLGGSGETIDFDFGFRP